MKNKRKREAGSSIEEDKKAEKRLKKHKKKAEGVGGERIYVSGPIKGCKDVK
jgi:hypothetical protein